MLGLLLGGVALGLVITSSNIMATMIRRANVLRHITDPVQRDQLCRIDSADDRNLDRSLDPQARVFLIGLLGETNAPRLGMYFYLRNYLFPHDIEISLGTNLVYSEQGFIGTPCDSITLLQSNGFDDVFNYDTHQFIVLTPRGQLR